MDGKEEIIMRWLYYCSGNMIIMMMVVPELVYSLLPGAIADVYLLSCVNGL